MKPLLALLFTIMPGLALASPASPVTGPESFAELSGVMVYENLYLAGQPDSQALAAAKAAGVSVVINLRTQGEMRFDEQSVAEELGLSYHHVPIAGATGFTPENLALLDDLAQAAGSEKVLVHCASGNRVGGWLANYLVTRQGVPVDEAFRVGRAAGLRSSAIETHIREQLKHTD
ncbi:MAG: sulfur transferase domain-containing protein [Lysobacterales bacterium]